jgi:UDP-2,3-diacylglucosamine hydrolase
MECWSSPFFLNSLNSSPKGLAMSSPPSLGLIAGNGIYPLLVVRAARERGVQKIYVAAFEGETRPEIADGVDAVEWMRVGQLGRLLNYFSKAGVHHAMMAGQIAPKNLFELRPDLKALLLLGALKTRNAETIFGGIANELGKVGVTLLPATTFLEDSLATKGWLAGPKPKRRVIDDAEYGFRIAKEISRLDIGQTVVIRHGTVVAVEAFEGTNDAIRRGGTLARGEAVVVKVSKPNQDFRFDVPVIGCQTIEVAGEAGVKMLAVEAARTLLLDSAAVKAAADHCQITIYGIDE